jgi:hypothetical protein
VWRWTALACCSGEECPCAETSTLDTGAPGARRHGWSPWGTEAVERITNRGASEGCREVQVGGRPTGPPWPLGPIGAARACSDAAATYHRFVATLGTMVRRPYWSSSTPLCRRDLFGGGQMKNLWMEPIGDMRELVPSTQSLGWHHLVLLSDCVFAAARERRTPRGEGASATPHRCAARRVAH